MSRTKPTIPPETIENIVLDIILCDDPRALRRATFNSLTLISRDWYLQARRLELFRLDVPSFAQLERLITHLTALKNATLSDSNTCRVPARWLTVDLGLPSDPTPFQRLSQLLDLLDTSYLQDLEIMTGFATDYYEDVCLLPPTKINGLPTLPRLLSFTSIHLSGDHVTSLIMACDATRLKTLTFDTIQHSAVAEGLRTTGVAFPDLTSLSVNYYYGQDFALFCGGPGVDVPVARNLQRIAFTNPVFVDDWPVVAERLERYCPPRLEDLKFPIMVDSSNRIGDVRSRATPLAKAMGCTLRITMMDACCEPIERYVSFCSKSADITSNSIA